MGADFLVFFHDWPLGKTQKETDKNFAKSIEAARLRILKLDAKKMDVGTLEEVLGDLTDDGAGEAVITGQDAKALRKRLLEDLHAVRMAYEERWRCVAVIHVGRRAALISGGESWGDLPNDFCGALDRLQRVGVLT